MTSLLRVIFPRRLNRVAYSVRLVGCLGFVALIYYRRGLTDDMANAVMLLGWIYVAFFVVLPRARECGMSFLYALFALVPLFFPFLAVALMFRPPDYRLSNPGEHGNLKP